MKFVIIGGVAGGMSAATRLRRLSEDAEIIVLERSGYVSFANCGLPYYLSGKIANRSSLLLQTPESLHQRFRLDVRVHHEVTNIDVDGQSVTVLDHTSGQEYQEHFDKLLLSPGAGPVRPPIPGIERALTLRNVEDTDKIHEAAKNSERITVIGGGFIGVEVAENLAEMGKQVTLIEATNQVMAPFDPEMASILHRELTHHGIDLRVNSMVTAIYPDSVKLADDTMIQTDLVIAAIGVAPTTELVKGTDIELGSRRGIQIDEHFATSAANIYAVGDAVEKVTLSGDPTLIPLANLANRQGRYAADRMMGRAGSELPSVGTAIVKVFDLQAASTGANEKALQRAGRRYQAIHTHPLDHAGYYPGASALAIKLLFDPNTEEILGAQVIGKSGADKRIDVLATAMAGGIKASQLANLELAYAPPFGSAKDPINHLGYVVSNIKSGVAKSVSVPALAKRLADGAVLVDVRTEAEYSRGNISGALNIPVDELRERISEIPTGRPIIVHCAVGVRAHTALRILAGHGFDVENLDGGYTTWQHYQEIQAPAGN